MADLDDFEGSTTDSEQSNDCHVVKNSDVTEKNAVNSDFIDETDPGTDGDVSPSQIEGSAAIDEVDQDETDSAHADTDNPVTDENPQDEGNEREVDTTPTDAPGTTPANLDDSQMSASEHDIKEGKARGGKKLIYGAFGLVAAIVVLILVFANSGPKLDASARLDQVTINYPSSWVLNSDERSITVNEGDVDSGSIIWATSGDYFGEEGVEVFTSTISDSADFTGELTEVDIDGTKAYRRAVSIDNLSGEALFVPTDEGTTFVLAVMPSNDEDLQKILDRVLDSAVLSPGTKCTITLKSDGSTTDTVVVYDYGNGASCTMNVDGANNGKKIPTSGRVITSWDADDSNVETALNDEGAWVVTGVTKDVTLDAIWTDAHKVTFTDGDGNEIATVGVLDGESATAPDNPSRGGFAFDGWDADFSKVTDDITVNAKWVAAHTVTFTDGMGNTLDTVAVRDGESAKAPSDPTRGGYTFAGWDAGFSNVTDDVTVNARWDSEFKASLRGLGDFEQTTVSGSGDDVIDMPCAGKPCLMIISNDGSRNFVVKTLDSAGNSVDLLVNTIGSYNGTVTTYQDYEDSQLVEIKSSGNWSITFAPLADMPDLSNGSSFTGDNVVAMSEDSLSKIHITNSGESNFVVRGIGYNSAKLLVNDIGSYDGTVAWGEPQCFFIVRSSGTWSISW